MGLGQHVKKARAPGATNPTSTRPPAAPSEREPKDRGTFHVPRTLLAEVRDAVVALSGPPVRLTLASLAETALRRELERLKKEHNQGKPFPKATDKLKGGRPIGS